MYSVAWKADIEQVILSSVPFIMMGGEAMGVLETFLEHLSWGMTLQLRLKDSKGSPEEERAVFPETVLMRHI